MRRQYTKSNSEPSVSEPALEVSGNNNGVSLDKKDSAAYLRKHFLISILNDSFFSMFKELRKPATNRVHDFNCCAKHAHEGDFTFSFLIAYN